jgi:hypothetical protein
VFPPIPDVKNIWVSLPEKYSGKDDIEKFNTWLTSLLPCLLRVDLCGTTLSGLAATWYADEVEDWNRKTKHWYFDDLVCTLYKRFLYMTAKTGDRLHWLSFLFFFFFLGGRRV